jgi:hypothetical protein
MLRKSEKVSKITGVILQTGVKTSFFMHFKSKLFVKSKFNDMLDKGERI